MIDINILTNPQALCYSLDVSGIPVCCFYYNFKTPKNHDDRVIGLLSNSLQTYI